MKWCMLRRRVCWRRSVATIFSDPAEVAPGPHVCFATRAEELPDSFQEISDLERELDGLPSVQE